MGLGTYMAIEELGDFHLLTTSTYMPIEEVSSVGGCGEEAREWAVGVAGVVEDFVKLHSLPHTQTVKISVLECRRERHGLLCCCCRHNNHHPLWYLSGYNTNRR